MKKLIGLLAAGLLPAVLAWGQVPPEVYYLLPDFGQGMVYFSDQRPAQGKMNICAEDQSLRYLDNDGQELASKADNITRVMIDTVVFVRDDGFFHRIYPVADEVSVALRRSVDIQRDAKKGAYGTVSRTSAIREVGSFRSEEGVVYKLEKADDYPYNVTETCFMYKEGSVIPFNKRNLRKHFPARKDDIDAWLKAGHTLPKTLDDTRAFLARLSSGEAL